MEFVKEGHIGVVVVPVTQEGFLFGLVGLRRILANLGTPRAIVLLHNPNLGGILSDEPLINTLGYRLNI